MILRGGELKALKGATDLLKRGAIAAIYSEILFQPHFQDGTNYSQLLHFLDAFNFSLYNLYNLKRGKNGRLRRGDALFIHSCLLG